MYFNAVMFDIQHKIHPKLTIYNKLQRTFIALPLNYNLNAD